MRGFLLGFLSAALIAAAAYRLLPRSAEDPCRFCGTGTSCEAQRCVAVRPGEAGAASTRKRSHRQQEGTLRPADLKQVAAGDNLKFTDVLNMAERGEGDDRELTQDDLDAIFRPHQDEMIACMDEARGEEQLSGRVTISFRVQRTGAIAGVRVEAPAYLIQHGLLGCVRAKINNLRFPPSSHSQIVTYPFALH